MLQDVQGLRRIAQDEAGAWTIVFKQEVKSVRSAIVCAMLSPSPLPPLRPPRKKRRKTISLSCG